MCGGQCVGWPGWAIKALKGCRNIMSSQQGQTLARKSLSCTLAHLPYIFIHMKWNVTLSTISAHTSHLKSVESDIYHAFSLLLHLLLLTFTLSAVKVSVRAILLGEIEVRLSWFTTSPTVHILSYCSDPKRRPISLPFPVYCKTSMHMHCTDLHVQKDTFTHHFF